MCHNLEEDGGAWDLVASVSVEGWLVLMDADHFPHFLGEVRLPHDDLDINCSKPVADGGGMFTVAELGWLPSTCSLNLVPSSLAV